MKSINELQKTVVPFFLLILLTLMWIPYSSAAETPEANISVYTVQIGASHSETDAQRVVSKLEKKGYQPYILDIFDSRNTLWQTIHLGKFSSKKDAQDIRNEFNRKENGTAYVFKTSMKMYHLFLSRRKGISPTRGEKLITKIERRDPEHLPPQTSGKSKPKQASSSLPVVEKISVATREQPPATKHTLEKTIAIVPPIEEITPIETLPPIVPEERLLVKSVPPPAPLKKEPTVTPVAVPPQKTKHRAPTLEDEGEHQTAVKEILPTLPSTLFKPERTTIQPQETSRTGSARQFYVGIASGLAMANITGSDLNSELTARGYTVNSTVDNSSLGWKVFGGVRLLDYLALETAYVNLGEIGFTVQGDVADMGGFLQDAATIAPLSVRGQTFTPTGIWPITKDITLTCKLGAFVWFGDLGIGTESLKESRNEQGINVVYGVGGQYSLFGVTSRLEWERYHHDNIETDLFSLGVQYNFN